MSQKIYAVQWQDAWSHDDGYYDSNSKYSSMTIIDVGFLCEDTDDGVLLASSNCIEDGGRRHLKFIPTAMIDSIWEVTL